MHIIRNANLALNLRVKGTVLNGVNVKNNFVMPQKHNFKASLYWFFSSASVLELSELHTDCVLNNGDLISFSTSIGHTKNVEKQITQSKGIVALSISKIMSIYFEHAERSRSGLLSVSKQHEHECCPALMLSDVACFTESMFHSSMFQTEFRPRLQAAQRGSFTLNWKWSLANFVSYHFKTLALKL